MLHDLAHQHAVLEVALELLWQRALLGIFIGALRRRKGDVNSGTFASKDLSVETLLAKVNGSTINLIHQQSGDRAVDLHSELGALDDIKTADERVDDKGETNAVVDGNSVSFVRDLDDGFVAATDEDGLVLLRRDLDDLARGIKILDEPLAALEFPAGRLARAHVFGLRFFAGCWGLAPHGTALRDDGSGAQVGVLVRHLRFVDLAEARGDTLALVELVEDSAHVCCWCRRGRSRRNTRRRRWGRSAATGEVEGWDRGRRGRGRKGTATDRSRSGLDLPQSFHGINARLIVPCQTLGVVFLEVLRKSLEVLIVGFDIFDVYLVPVKLSTW